MSLNGNAFEKKQRPIPPQGPQVAVCYSIIDLGTHMKSFQNQEAKPTPLLHISWELPNLPFAVFKEGDQPKPLALFQEYSTSMGDKAKLPKLLTSWRGVPPTDLAKELPQFLGQPCLINVEYKNDKQKPEIIYANVAMNGLGVMRLPTNTQVNNLTNPKVFFNLDQYSHAQFLTLPEWIRKKIMSSLEWSGIVAKYGTVPVQQEQTNGGPQNNGFQNNNQGFNQNQNFNNNNNGFTNQQGAGSNQQTNNGFVNNTNVQPQNTGFQTTHSIPANNQTPAQQNNGVGFGGEIIKGNPFNQVPF